MLNRRGPHLGHSRAAFKNISLIYCVRETQTVQLLSKRGSGLHRINTLYKDTDIVINDINYIVYAHSSQTGYLIS